MSPSTKSADSSVKPSVEPAVEPAVEVTLPSALRCSYPFKFCNSPRAVKTTGDLHKLCQMHRHKANMNQKRLQQKRRRERQKVTAQQQHEVKHSTSVLVASVDVDALLRRGDTSTATTLRRFLSEDSPKIQAVSIRGGYVLRL